MIKRRPEIGPPKFLISNDVSMNSIITTVNMPLKLNRPPRRVADQRLIS